MRLVCMDMKLKQPKVLILGDLALYNGSDIPFFWVVFDVPTDVIASPKDL